VVKNFKKNIGKAKVLRKRSTEAEKRLWGKLRAKQLGKLKFRRQQPIGKYIVDFISFEKSIVIELDGGQHAIEKERDIQRDEWLKREGFKILRFWDNDVLENLEGVMEVIQKNCMSPSPPLPSREGRLVRISLGNNYFPPPRGGGKGRG
jgi:very-short-patch-repair endonuclease